MNKNGICSVVKTHFKILNFRVHALQIVEFIYKEVKNRNSKNSVNFPTVSF